MANVYTVVIPRPAAIPASVEVRIVAGRPDGGDLTAEELEALRATYPSASPAEVRPAAKAKRPKASATKPAKPSAKRAAARRP